MYKIDIDYELKEVIKKRLLRHCDGSENKITKREFWNLIGTDSTIYNEQQKAEFNSSRAARWLSDVFDQINNDCSTYAVVSDKGGIFITNNDKEKADYQEALYNEGIAKLIKARNIGRLPKEAQQQLRGLLDG